MTTGRSRRRGTRGRSGPRNPGPGAVSYQTVGKRRRTRWSPIKVRVLGLRSVQGKFRYHSGVQCKTGCGVDDGPRGTFFRVRILQGGPRPGGEGHRLCRADGSRSDQRRVRQWVPSRTPMMRWVSGAGPGPGLRPVWVSDDPVGSSDRSGPGKV